MFGSDIPLITNQLPLSFDLPEDQKEWNQTMQLMVKRINSVMNTKEGALYVPQEVATFQLYFTIDNPQKFRNTYRKTFDMVELNGGPIAPGAALSFPHDIATIVDPTRIFGTATTALPNLAYLPLPYASADLTKVIEIWFNATTVNLINATNANFTLTQCYITFEWTKN